MNSIDDGYFRWLFFLITYAFFLDILDSQVLYSAYASYSSLQDWSISSLAFLTLPPLVLCCLSRLSFSPVRWKRRTATDESS